MAKKTKSFFKLSAAERAAETAKLDRGVDFEETSPLSATQQARFERARAARTGPEEGQARVVISIDPKLLLRIHTRAKKEGKSISQLVNEALQASDRRAG